MIIGEISEKEIKKSIDINHLFSRDVKFYVSIIVKVMENFIFLRNLVSEIFFSLITAKYFDYNLYFTD